MGGLCVTCASPLTSTENERGEFVDYRCPRCGSFTLTKDAEAAIPDLLGRDKRKQSVLAHAILQMQRREASPCVNLETVHRILDADVLPTLFEQADNLIIRLGDHLQADPGAQVELRPDVMPAVVGASSYEGYRFVLSHLVQEGMVEGTHVDLALNQKVPAPCRLSFTGWERYGRLLRGASKSRKAFMAMKFDDPLLEKIFTEVFRPAVAATGFDLRTLNDEPKAGLIDDRMRVEILTSRFLIADLTHGNQGAYWEAGYAEGLGKPVFYTCEKSVFDREKTHFDTNHHYTVPWEKDKLGDAAEKLKAAIRATLPQDAKLTDD